MSSRREFVGSLCRTAAVFSLSDLLPAQRGGVEFFNIAKQARLTAKTVFGSE